MSENKPLLVITNEGGANLLQSPDKIKAFMDSINSTEEVNVKDLEDGNQLKEIAESASKLMTMGVGFLRDPNQFPNAAINELMADAWCIIGNQIVQPAMVPGMPIKTISFVVTGNVKQVVSGAEWNSAVKGVVLLPLHYSQLFKKDATGQFGALVYIGSHCRDFYNDRFGAEASKEVEARALAYEAEYYRCLASMGTVAMSNYAKNVLDRFPQGINSLDPSMLYTPKQRPPET